MPKLVSDLRNVGALAESTDRAAFPSYDFIIVGGGTSGCVLANRLSEDANVSVLLLESGPTSQGLLPARAPMIHGLLFRTKHDYDLPTTYTVRGLDKVHHWPRARMLGGCSSMNAMIYQYCAPSDYDEWTFNGNPEFDHWKFSEFLQYFKKLENFNSPIIPGVKSEAHSVTGPVVVGFNSEPGPISGPFINACAMLGIQKNVDFNTPGGTLGVNRFMTYVDPKGNRVSTETAYLTNTVLNRPNLKVATGAHVTRILFDSNKRAIGAEFCSDSNGPKYVALARQEVILSAGTVHTPQILMLSGIGPADHLDSFSIPVVSDLPGVGANLMDHLVIQTRYRAKPEYSFHFLNMKPPTLVSTFQTITSAMKFLLFGKGAFACNNASTAAFVRTDDTKIFKPADFPHPVADLTSGSHAPNVEIYSCPMAWKNQNMDLVAPGYLVSLGTILLRPQSKGSIKLQSKSPFKSPIVKPGYLKEQNDVDVLVAALRLAHRITQEEPYATCLSPSTHVELDHELHKLDDAQLANLVHERAETLYHPTSTARMAPLENQGVVDGRLRVYGVTGLRVVDASVFPTIVSGHPSAACIAIAEKAADMIKAAH